MQAYAYHDRALAFLREQQQTAVFEAMAEAVGPPSAEEDVRIAIAVEDESEKEGRVALRVRELNDGTRRTIETMMAHGYVPYDVSVEEVGPMYGYAGPRDLAVPLLAGVSCAHRDGTRGTLGCFVRSNGVLLLLSANHVIAQENRAALGTDIVQPAAGITARRTIGTLRDFEPLALLGNQMDGAVAEVTVPDVRPELFNGKRITGVRTRPLLTGDVVFKFGQSTKERSGTVRSTTSNITLEMDFADYAFDLQIEVASPPSRPFGCKGDSGALVYDEDDLAVGILIGGNCKDRTYVTPIDRLLSRFTATLA